MITAPRRFGKTTNLDMLLSFFSGLMDNEIFMKLKIGESTSMKWWGKFNVVYVTFGHFAGDICSKEDCVKACQSILHAAFQHFDYIESALPESDVTAFNEWLDEKLYLKKTDTEVGNGLRFSVDCVAKYDSNKHVLLLVDKFDRICSSAFWKMDENTLDVVMKFYCDMVGNAVKHEPKCVAVLTGVTAVSYTHLTLPTIYSV